MKTIKRLLATIMIVALIISCFAISASAADYYVYIGASAFVISDGDGVKDLSTSGAVKTGEITFDPSSKTLTLKNAVIDSGANPGIKFCSTDGNCTIIVKGDCKITTGSGSKCSGILAAANNLTIVGDGKLTIETTYDSSNHGIELWTGKTLTIGENVTLDIDTKGYCLYGSSNSNIIIKDNAILDLDTTGSSKCISGSYITIDGNAKVTATSEDSDYGTIDGSSGVVIKGNANVDVETWGTAMHSSNKVLFQSAGKCNLRISKSGGSGSYLINAGSIEFNLAPGGKVILDTTVATGKDVVSANPALTECVCTEPADGNMFAAGVQKAVVENPLVDYKIKQTADELVWTKGCCEAFKISSEAVFSKFAEKVEVDGDVVSDEHYTAMDGSTAIIFRASYLETLSAGKHTIEIFSDDGSAKGTFTIVDATKAEEKEKVAQTGDNNAIGAFVALTAFSAVGYVTLKKHED